MYKRNGPLISIIPHTILQSIQFPAECFLFFKENQAMFGSWRLHLPVSTSSLVLCASHKCVSQFERNSLETAATVTVPPPVKWVLFRSCSFYLWGMGGGAGK